MIDRLLNSASQPVICTDRGLNGTSERLCRAAQLKSGAIRLPACTVDLFTGTNLLPASIDLFAAGACRCLFNTIRLPICAGQFFTSAGEPQNNAWQELICNLKFNN